MNERKTICLLSFSAIASDARVLRHLKFLGANFDLIAIGYGDDPSARLPGVRLVWHQIQPAWGGKFRKIIRTLLRWPGRFLPAFDWYPDQMMADWRAARDIVATADYDLFFGNDVAPLLIGVWQRERRGRPFIMDYHEYAPLEAEEKAWHRWFHGPQMYRLLKRFGALAAGSATVNSIFADKFMTEFGLHPVTVMNAPELVELPPPEPRGDDRIHLAFHGNPGGRNLEALIEAMSLLDDRFVLHLMVMSGAEAGSPFRQLAERAPGRVIFEPTVTPSETVIALSRWDIGFTITPPVNFNERHALPNKFFDYIHAGLAVICGSSVIVGGLTEQHGFGWVLPDVTPQSIAERLRSLAPAEIAAKKSAARLWRTRVHASTEEARIVELARRALAA